MRKTALLAFLIVPVLASNPARAFDLGAVPGSSVARAYAVRADIRSAADGRIAVSLELRNADSRHAIGSVHFACEPGSTKSFEVRPGLELRFEGHPAADRTIAYSVEIIRLGLVEARHEATVTLPR